ncbi:DUF2812 domain-containing protein [Clostridium akagii]|uniref:DUF2812 domain-containing protein n=1 Tax=Clostridium akagii TaxID=91623 RepID=UPI00068E2C31|nr:DUF2812 domain-containing protein [Clostridium akagii]
MKVFKFWWAWQYETIENWLEEMELKGKQLKKVSCIGTVFHFEDSSPQKARYCVDYQEKLTPEYIKLATEDGWDIWPIVVGWVVLRKEYTGERPEFYSEYDSIIIRNSKINFRMMVAFLPALALGNMLFILFRDELSLKPLGFGFLIIYCALTIFYAFVIINIFITNRVLIKKKNINNK